MGPNKVEEKRADSEKRQREDVEETLPLSGRVFFVHGVVAYRSAQEMGSEFRSQGPGVIRRSDGLGSSGRGFCFGVSRGYEVLGVQIL